MIIYFDNGKNPFTDLFIKSGYSCISPYKRYIKRRIVKVLEKHRCFREFLYNDIEVKDNEVIVVFDSNISSEYLTWLKKKCPNNRIIFWYWNPVNTTLHPSKIPSQIEKWSYSPSDCIKYGLNENTTFYFDCLCIDDMVKCPRREKQRVRAVFVGRDKGRVLELIRIKEMLETQNIVCDFHFIHNVNPRDDIQGVKYEPPMEYSRIIDIIKNSDVIIDYYTDDDAGISLRPMEALFFGKKIITNNKHIKEYDFFCKRNFLSLDEWESNIVDFITDEYAVLDDDIKRRYMLSSWFDRFTKG